MDSLSDEILIEIFEWLPGRTRKECRLVCQKWNRISQSYMFTQSEKIVFYNGCDLDTMAPLFEFRHRRTLNLHFICIIFLWTDVEISFWRTYGERVESIHLVDGNFNFVELKRIIEFCPNLKCVKLQCYKALTEWLSNFEAFVELRFIAPSVTTFHFEVHQNGKLLLSNYKMYKILAMFPELKNLKLEFNFDVDITHMFELKTKLNIFVILQILCGVAHKLKKLYLKTRVPYSICPDVSTLLSNLQTVEELTLIPSFNFVGINLRPYAPLLKLTQITSLNLAMGTFKLDRSVAEFISIVLHEFTNLRHLHLNEIHVLELHEGLIQSLVHSALKSLSLNLGKLVFGVNIQQYNSSGINRTLEKISIYSYMSKIIIPNVEEHAHFFSVLGQYFQNVNDMTVSYPNDAILQHIFQYQKRLRKLQLESCFSCTDFGFTGLRDSTAAEGEEVTYCISELSDLEFLRINPANKISEKTFTRFILPKLKTLELVDFGHKEISLYLFQQPMPYLTKFEVLMKNSPLLEVLNLNFSQFVPQEEMEEMLRPFKQLRYVEVSDHKNHKNAVSIMERLIGPSFTTYKSVIPKSTYKYKRFFEICPFLRKFVHNDKQCHFNVLTKMVEVTFSM